MSLVTMPATFTPASSCFGATNIWQILATGSYYYYLQGPPPTSTSDCLPPGYVPSTETFYVGPCPLGYSTACINIRSLDTYTVSIATCCPRSVLLFLSSLLETLLYIFTMLPAATRSSNASPRQAGFGNRLWVAALNSRKQKTLL
jgi:hypothetical protein